MTPQTFLLAKRTVFPRSAAQKIYKRFNFNSNDYICPNQIIYNMETIKD